MDKQTLSNYGWLVIVTLILAVMLALATPFGTYVGDAVVSVANGYVGASNNAMDDDNIGKMEQQWSDKLGSVSSKPNKLVAGIYVYGYVNNDVVITFDEPLFITWEELAVGKDIDGYASITPHVTDTSIPDFAFDIGYVTTDGPYGYTSYPSIDVRNIIVPNTVTYFGYASFRIYQNNQNNSITYLGTMEQWENIEKDSYWNDCCGQITVTCSDGTIIIPATW